MIDLRRLEALVALHRTGTVSAAAEQLHYGQPTVSHHLRRLEAETGAVLLRRAGRGVRLTPEGERLATRAFPSGAATLVPRAIALLADRHPGLDLDLTEAEPPEAAELLRAGSVDLALTFAYPDQPEPDGITSTAVHDDPLFLVGAVGSVVDEPGAVDLARCSGTRWITGCERCRRELLTLCDEAGFEPEIAFASDDYVAVQSLVATGLGVTVLPGLALRAHQHPAVVRRPLPGASRRVQVSTYGAPPHPPAVDAVARVLAEVASGS
jgi:DNA-binding transcriptional LysR family regulator